MWLPQPLNAPFPLTPQRAVAAERPPTPDLCPPSWLPAAPLGFSNGWMDHLFSTMGEI